MAGVVLYASLFEPNVARLDLYDPPATHRDGPGLLNVLRILDMPAAVAMAAERSDVTVHQRGGSGWEYPAAVVRKMGWPDRRLVIEPPPGE